MSSRSDTEDLLSTAGRPCPPGEGGGRKGLRQHVTDWKLERGRRARRLVRTGREEGEGEVCLRGGRREVNIPEHVYHPFIAIQKAESTLRDSLKSDFLILARFADSTLLLFKQL